ncbi:MAG TPA: PAS domain S-box protein, partial [Umezawaea sp.]|nr:PAS domain S-box protein [Umezawaea sp.]
MTLPDAPSLLCDSKGVVMQANAAAVELARAESSDVLVGKRLSELLLGDQSDLRLHRATGTPLPVRVVRNPVPGTGLQAVLLVDVSDLASVADALRDEQRRLRTVQRVAGIGSWEYDPATGVTVWSDSHYELLGFEPGTVVPGAQAVLDVVHPDDHEMVASYWTNRELSGDAIDIEYRIIRPDGELRRIRGVAEAKMAADGSAQLITGYIMDMTAQWRADQDLAIERGRLLDAQRIARIGSWAFDVEAQTMHRSEVLVEMYGEIEYEPGAQLVEGVHPDDMVRLDELRDKLLAAVDESPIEVEVRSKYNDKVFICRARPEFGPGGKIERLHGTVQDVTEARLLERQLHEDRRRLADAQKAARLGVWEWDLQSDAVVWSDMLADLFAVPRDERTSYQTFLDLVHPDDRAWVDELWQQLVADGSPVQCEHRIVRRDGKVRVFRSYGVVIESRPGERSRAVGTAQDITEQRAAETRMKRSSQRFADLVSLTPVGIGLFDEAERLVDANDALCDLLGMELEELRGVTAEQMTHPDDNQSRLQSVGRMTALGADRTHKIPQRILIRPDGERVYCELHIALSVQDDGRRFWLIVFQDITERRRTAEALRHQATHDELTGLP